MARKLVKSIKFGRCTVTIHRDSYANEYVVREKIGTRITGGKADGGYFTDDKRDARGAAAAMVRKLKKRGVCK